MGRGAGRAVRPSWEGVLEGLYGHPGKGCWKGCTAILGRVAALNPLASHD